MGIRAVSLITVLLASTNCAGSSVLPAVPVEASRADPAAAAVAEVRGGYFARDWWACARAGEGLLAKHPDSARLRAWTIACAARAEEDALPLADKMLAERPGEPWGLFARASALIDDDERGPDEGIPAARAAVQALAHPDATWLLARALVVHGKREEAAAFFAEQRRRRAAPELLALELASSLNTESTDAQVQALAEQLRALEPRFVDGWFLAAVWMLLRRRPADAEPLLARALELSPHSPAIHARRWEAILQSQRSPDDKRAAIDADFAALRDARGGAPVVLNEAAMAYDGLSKETAKKLRDELLARFPDSKEAEWVRFEQLRPLYHAWGESRQKHAGKADPAAVQALRAALDVYIARPRHAVPQLLGAAYMWRYFLVKDDPGASPEALLAAAQEFAAHERHNFHLFAEAATLLAERTKYHAEAEALVREGLRRAELQFARDEVPETSMAYVRSLLFCGLGAVLQAQGRLAEAREALQKAHALNHGHPEPFIRLAALAVAEGKPDEAERLLIEGLTLEYGVDKIEAALKAQYRGRHGSDRGYAKYRAGVDRELRERRRAAVLATRLAEPKPLAAFALPRLGGGEVRSEALAGRVSVINLWSTSCGPCVEELPALQKLVDAFAGAPDVAFTTIITDAQTDSLPAWMKQRELSFEVLFGGGWFFDAGYRVMPTTLFVDPGGRVVFVKEGATDRLVEEFTWRIETMRPRAPSRAAKPKRGA